MPRFSSVSMTDMKHLNEDNDLLNDEDDDTDLMMAFIEKDEHYDKL